MTCLAKGTAAWLWAVLKSWLAWMKGRFQWTVIVRLSGALLTKVRQASAPPQG